MIPRVSALLPYLFAPFLWASDKKRLGMSLAFSCKQFTAIRKEFYEKFYRLGWFSKAGNPPTGDNSSPYKQALSRLGLVHEEQVARGTHDFIG